MSLDVKVNIVKGWPSPSIVEKSLPASSGSLSQGDIVRVHTDGKWSKGITDAHVDQIPFIIMVDSTDPSTNRGAHKSDYKQVPYGAIHGIGFNNALEVETANYDTNDTYAVGAALSAPAGVIKVAEADEVVIATVSRAPYTLGNQTYLTFIPTANKRVVA